MPFLYHKFKGDYPTEFGDPRKHIQRTAALAKSVAASARRSVDLWLVGAGVDARESSLRKPHFVTASSARPVAATVSNTRFVQGGDHFMTTFTSRSG